MFDRDALEKAGAERADAFVAVTSGDNSNVVSATIARDIYRIPKVVARIFDPRRADIYRRLGIPTVSSVSWAANEISSLVLHQQLVRDVTLGDGEVQLVKISIPPRLVGRTVDDLSDPRRGDGVRHRPRRAVVHPGRTARRSTTATCVEVAVLTSAMPKLKQMITP